MNETGQSSSEEEFLRRGLHQLAGSCHAPCGTPRADLLMARGRTVRRRRLSVVAGSAALLGVLSAGGVYGDVFGKAADQANAGDTMAGKSDIARTADILKSLLPKGEVTKRQSQVHGNSFRPYTGGSLVYDEGKGASAISIVLDRVDSPASQTTSRVRCSVGADGVGNGTWGGDRGTCTVKKQPDGSFLTTGKQRDGQLVSWFAILEDADGSYLTLQEYNAPAATGVAPTRDQPPLTLQQLSDVVMSDRWDSTLDSLPRRGGTQAYENAPSGKEMARALEQSLPSGVKVVRDTGGTSPTEFAEIPVDDGMGEAVIEVRVDRHGRNDGAQIRFTEHQGPFVWSPHGVLSRSVTANRPGNFQVVVTAYNSASAFGKPTRATPPLTMKQIRAIAAGSEWDAFA